VCYEIHGEDESSGTGLYVDFFVGNTYSENPQVQYQNFGEFSGTSVSEDPQALGFRRVLRYHHFKGSSVTSVLVEGLQVPALRKILRYQRLGGSSGTRSSEDPEVPAFRKVLRYQRFGGSSKTRISEDPQVPTFWMILR